MERAFFTFTKTFLITVDEAIQYNVSELWEKTDAYHIPRAMLRVWFRYSGPPEVIELGQKRWRKVWRLRCRARSLQHSSSACKFRRLGQARYYKFNGTAH